MLDDLSPVKDAEEARSWLSARGIEDIECVVPDIAGVPRGKMMPVSKFLSSGSMLLPSSIFRQTIAGDYPDEDGDFTHDPIDGDNVFVPDFSTLTLVPWESDPTALVIHDAYLRGGEKPQVIAPRQVLKNILERYEAQGLRAVIAPEIEFYLVKPNHDPDYPLEPPIGRSGRPEVGRQSLSISALNEFDDFIDDIYDFSGKQGLEIDTLVHEEGKAQMEINLRHGDPLTLCDQVFLFKRTIREAALRHDMYATFMAKPIAEQPGSAMHIHQSLISAETGGNIFSEANGDPSEAFFHFLAGQQNYLGEVMCMMAPYVNSFRRIHKKSTAPINLYWGHENRTVGLRVPDSPSEGRRVENRLPSSDANPYLAVAASLACGLVGLTEKRMPDKPVQHYASDLPSDLPRDLLEAVNRFSGSEAMKELFGKEFVATYCAIKQEEYQTFMRVISPWEREYLLLNV